MSRPSDAAIARAFWEHFDAVSNHSIDGYLLMMVKRARELGAEVKVVGDFDWDAVHEALESMDDFARMEVGVKPYGPYAVLRNFITTAKGWQELAALTRVSDGKLK